jgi:hypothetical protein
MSQRGADALDGFVWLGGFQLCQVSKKSGFEQDEWLWLEKVLKNLSRPALFVVDPALFVVRLRRLKPLL